MSFYWGAFNLTLSLADSSCSKVIHSVFWQKSEQNGDFISRERYHLNLGFILKLPVADVILKRLGGRGNVKKNKKSLFHSSTHLQLNYQIISI